MLLTAPLLLTIALSAFLVLALGAALVLVLLNLRTPTTMPLVIASALLVASTVVTAVSSVSVSVVVGLLIALIAVALAVLGGNPVTRRVLEIAAGQRVTETPDGGIVLLSREEDDRTTKTLLRGGTTIGYLERLAVVLAIIVGFPEAVAVIVAIKGIGRFSELGEPEARERFIIGTLASLIWACLAGAIVRLAIW